MPTTWKPYHAIIFSRSENRFRGLHQGYSVMEDNQSFSRFMINFGSRRLSLIVRDGTKRRNQIDGEIHQVHILPTAKMLAISDKVFAAPPNELWDFRMRWSQFENLAYDPTTWSEWNEVEWQDRIPSNTF